MLAECCPDIDCRRLSDCLQHQQRMAGLDPITLVSNINVRFNHHAKAQATETWLSKVLQGP